MVQGAWIQCKYLVRQFFSPNLSALILPTGSEEQFLDLPALPHPQIPLLTCFPTVELGKFLQADDPQEDMFSSFFVAQQICSTLGYVIQVAALDLIEHEIQEVPQEEHFYPTPH